MTTAVSSTSLAELMKERVALFATPAQNAQAASKELDEYQHGLNENITALAQQLLGTVHEVEAEIDEIINDMERVAVLAPAATFAANLSSNLSGAKQVNKKLHAQVAQASSELAANNKAQALLNQHLATLKTKLHTPSPSISVQQIGHFGYDLCERMNQKQ